MARNHDPHDRLMALRNQLTWDKSSIRIIEHRIDELKAAGVPALIRSLQEEADRTLKRVRTTESMIKELEIQLFGK